MLSLKLKYQDLCFGVKESVETNQSKQDRITFFNIAANMAVKTDLIDKSGYYYVIK